ncbi:DUF1003 domain-containing protein [Frankia sp. AgW1.1]|uniref:DUF1003 domain-containing protein n=1 Tax=Frankia sp. AgW1.1 TaxID=1836971 RepID=UPI001931B026|nr:DUF1003 domain-containing protein [Frankia sp. AgW1.1]MBL7492868.1 DUF1003 domain-containing protein [Frankia sp. AgW1.1]
MSITTTASRVVSRRATERLDIPAPNRTMLLPRGVNREAFSRGAERIARFLGTGRYLAIQTVLVVVWIGLNVAIPLMRWDPYPFILLNLAFSTQAAYAAPLILLAQNRQDDRDKASLAEDRAAALRIRDDAEFLAREVAALRLAQSDAATRQYLRGELAHQLDSLRDDLRLMVLDAVRDTLAAAPGPGSAAVPVAAGVGVRAVVGGEPSADVDPALNGVSGRRSSRSAATRSTGGHRTGGERRRAASGPAASTASALLSPDCRRGPDLLGDQSG